MAQYWGHFLAQQNRIGSRKPIDLDKLPIAVTNQWVRTYEPRE